MDRNEYMREWRARKRTHLRKYQSDWRAKNSAKVLQAKAAYRAKHNVRLREVFRQRYAALRAAVIAAYGGCCTCCGELETVFLEIDHVFNDGAEERRRIGGFGKNFYYWLKMQNFPTDRYQLLCANCNQAKKRVGICPHVAKRK